ncbi:MAG: hypothetical protein ABW224_13685 [Kibdelosporangium sp.]
MSTGSVASTPWTARSPDRSTFPLSDLVSHHDDPWRLLVAVHEMGHAVVWHHAGFTVEDIRVIGHGQDTSGYVRLEQRPLRLPIQFQNCLVGLLAGREADRRWCDLTGQSPQESGSSADATVFRRMREDDNQSTRWVTDLSDREFVAMARRAVVTHWTQITRLASQLARRGVVTL